VSQRACSTNGIMTIGERSLRNLFYARYQARILSVSLAGGLTYQYHSACPKKRPREVGRLCWPPFGVFQSELPSEIGGMPFCTILIAMTPSERASAGSVDWHSSKCDVALFVKWWPAVTWDVLLIFAHPSRVNRTLELSNFLCAGPNLERCCMPSLQGQAIQDCYWHSMALPRNVVEKQFLWTIHYTKNIVLVL
jgi:hypothetical protein